MDDGSPVLRSQRFSIRVYAGPHVWLDGTPHLSCFVLGDGESTRNTQRERPDRNSSGGASTSAQHKVCTVADVVMICFGGVAAWEMWSKVSH